MKPVNFQRFARSRQNPNGLPPGGMVDLAFDPVTGKFIQVNPDGTTAPLGAAEASATVETTGSTSYTLTSADNGKVLIFENASPATVSFSSSLPVGFNCAIVRKNASVTFSGDIVTASEGSEILSVYGIVSVLKISSAEILISGNI